MSGSCFTVLNFSGSANGLNGDEFPGAEILVHLFDESDIANSITIFGIEGDLAGNSFVAGAQEGFTDSFGIWALCVLHSLQNREISVIAHGRCGRNHGITAVMPNSVFLAADVLLGLADDLIFIVDAVGQLGLDPIHRFSAQGDQQQRQNTQKYPLIKLTQSTKRYVNDYTIS